MDALQPSVLLVPYIASAAVTAALAVYALRQAQEDRADKTILAFIAIVTMVTIWSIARIGEFLFVDETITRFWITVLYVGLGGATSSVLFFALAFTGRNNLLTRRNVALVLVVPAVAVAVAGTNQFHNLFWTGEFVTVGELLLFEREFSLLLFIYLGYVYFLFLSAAYLLLRMALSSAQVYRRQTLAFVVGTAVPFGFGLLYTLDAVPGLPTYFDPTPLGFAVAGLCFGYAIFRHRMLDLIPIARDTVIESMRDGYVVIDTKGRIVDHNDAASELWGTTDELVGNGIGAVMPEATPLINNHDHGTRTEDELTVDIDGETRVLFANISSLTHNENTIGRLLLLRDITERRAVQKRYQALIENSSDIIFVAEKDGTITYVSPSIRNLMDSNPADLVGRNAFELAFEADQDVLRDGFAEILNEPGATTRREYRTRDDDGTVRVLEAVARNMLHDPFVDGIVINAREITERKERERELAKANEELETANEQLEEFASVISHDLRNPLNVAKGHLDLARELGDDEHFEKVDRSLDRMGAIIDDVLTLARQGEAIGETEPVNLEATAQEAWDHVSTDEAELVVTENGSFEADRVRLLQLLENLFRNAHEHAGSDVTVRIGLEDGCVYVEDDGPGIPPDRRGDVLESGYTTNDEGTGFGLSIVSQIANAHGWKISVTDGANGGARFEFAGIESHS